VNISLSRLFVRLLGSGVYFFPRKFQILLLHIELVTVKWLLGQCVRQIGRMQYFTRWWKLTFLKEKTLKLISSLQDKCFSNFYFLYKNCEGSVLN